MFSNIWHSFFFDPIYNTLVFFIDVFKGGDVGLAIIATVVLVKLILLPLSIKAAKTQKIIREIEPRLKEIKDKFKDKREEQAQAMLALYKEAGINPLSSVALLFIQLPIVIALYLAVSNGGGIPLPQINTDLLYSFIPNPALASMNFFGVFDITSRSFVLALLAGITQFYQVKMIMPELGPKDPKAAPNFKDDFMRNMQLQMRYVMPVIIFFAAYALSAAIALYFVVSNVAAILQEIYIKKHR
jgi:YidC/Oxa1 family membrane protein insertase